MILIGEELEVESPRIPFHFGMGLNIYPYTPHFTAPFDPSSFQVPVDSLGQILGQLTMAEQLLTSQTVSSDAATT